MSKKNNQKKTNAKRLGIKSVLIHGENRLAITTFGKGNAAEIALITDTKGDEIKDKLPIQVGGGQVYTIAPDIDVKGRDYQDNLLEVVLENPAERAGEDYLKLKSQLEIEFFGREFPKDNIRIQIIYNILDIQKILGLYINDIIYCVNNLQEDLDKIEEKDRDIVGLAMNDNKKVNERLQRIIPYMGFFGEAFQVPPKPKKDKNGKIIEEETSEDVHNVSVLRVLGAMRQITAHFKNCCVILSKNSELESTLNKKINEDLTGILKKEFKVDWSIVESNWKVRVEKINGDFMKNSAINLRILFDMLKPKNSEERLAIVKDYYDFSILKVGKNLGINMKKLRELIFKDCFHEVRAKEHDSYRQKINRITDFFLFRQYRNTATIDRWVKELRGTASNEVKEKLYVKFARDAAMMLGSTSTSGKIRKLIELLVGYFDNKNRLAEISPLDDKLLANISLKGDYTTPLTKLIAFLCNFWEGKEINELLSAYIHKFENIQTFIDTLKELKEEVKFAEKYELFNEKNNEYAGQIADELRILASIGKMKPNLEGAKRQLYKAAIEILGVPDDSDKLSNEWIEKNLLLSAEEKKNKARKDEVNPFRNFIANNVIESRRFMYLVRYTKPMTARALMQNRNIVHYVLSRIGDIQDVHVHGSQIDKYYLNLPNANEKENDKNRKIDALADYLVKFSFDTILKNRKGIIENTKLLPAKKNVAIEHLKALTGLYLTVAFIAVKNLVKTNARYYIAFAAIDRDLHLFTEKLKDDPNFKPEIGKYKNYLAITEHFLNEDDNVKYVSDPNLSDAENKKALFKFLDMRAAKWHFTKKWNDILRNNILEAKKIQETGGLLAEVRNHAEHLNVIMNLEKYVGDFRKNNNKPMQSYFELYHYVLQRMMIEPEYLKAWNIGELADKVTKSNTPSHDWIKYAYVSLAYNLPRYKNLTIEALFDEDSESGKVLTAKW
ncbi:MAG: type VI-D CRISPR-associated RNA-guided ribonuclease Cas13d, partial [Planctomycetaceae bacterium]|nr:type VI-D CRISPR-associated RNA-guided ribonuclease Cas13d [Planctomycetaceae bacterium]